MNRSIRFLAMLLACITLLSLLTLAQSGTWAFTGPVVAAGSNASSTLLKDGRVLFAGGNLGGIGVASKSAQLYSPSPNSWSAAANMKAARNWPSATLLADGRVLIVGGSNGKLSGNNLVILKTAEIFDPASGTFNLSGAKMKSARASQSSTLLPNGKVLIAGGMNVYVPRIRWGTCTNTAELYDPATDTFSPAGTMSVPRCGHTATLLPNGKVLVLSGATAELYDSTTNSWSATGSPASSRSGSGVAVLPNGKVLAAGPDASAELYDPVSGSWSATGSPSNTYANGASNPAVLLASGLLLMVGGQSAGGTTGLCELYNPFSGTWSATGSLNSTRLSFTVNGLSDGRVLATDGNLGYQVMSAEIYTP